MFAEKTWWMLFIYRYSSDAPIFFFYYFKNQRKKQWKFLIEVLNGTWSRSESKWDILRNKDASIIDSWQTSITVVVNFSSPPIIWPRQLLSIKLQGRLPKVYNHGNLCFSWIYDWSILVSKNISLAFWFGPSTIQNLYQEFSVFFLIFWNSKKKSAHAMSIYI